MRQNGNGTGTVPFENEVFVGASPQAMHGVYEDEQLTTIQKRICLIEFLIMVGLLFVEGGMRPKITKKTVRMDGFFFILYPIVFFVLTIHQYFY